MNNNSAELGMACNTALADVEWASGEEMGPRIGKGGAMDFPRTRQEFDDRFASEAACREYLFAWRWPDGLRCPRCGGTISKVNHRGFVECVSCAHQTSLTAGTVFHATKKPLRLWFEAMLLVVNRKNELTANEFASLLGISYPTAWMWLQKLRKAVGGRIQHPLDGDWWLTRRSRRRRRAGDARCAESLRAPGRPAQAGIGREPSTYSLPITTFVTIEPVPAGSLWLLGDVCWKRRRSLASVRLLSEESREQKRFECER